MNNENNSLDTRGTSALPDARPYRKYRNKRTDGYASAKEARRAGELKLLLQLGEISDLREQVRIELIPAQTGELACHYIADFMYRDKMGNTHVEDVKGFKTQEYIIKRKLLKFLKGITLEEI